MSAMLHRVAIVTAGVPTGTVLGVWLSEVSLGDSAELWTRYHQAIRGSYTLAVPPLGALTLVASVGMLLAPRGSLPLPHRRLVLAAISCLVLGMIITVGVHFPLNATIDTWPPATPPADWEQVRDRWLLAHGVRSVLSLAAFVLLVMAATGTGGREGRSENGASLERVAR
jgi:hypothetical protein